MVALRNVPVHFAFRGPTEVKIPLLKTPSQNTDGVKFADQLFVHTSKMTAGAAVCSSFLRAERRWHVESCSHHSPSRQMTV